MKSLIFILLLFASLLGFTQTTSIVTELYLSTNFTPKSGITPGSNNTQAMDCDQITTRYNVTISGVTSTGTRLPSQNELTSSAITPTYAATGKTFIQNVSSSGAITLSLAIQVGNLFGTYSGTTSTSWTTFAIESINNNHDGDGNNILTLKNSGTLVSGATNVTISGIASGSNSGLTLEVSDASGVLRNDITTQKLSITYHLVDSNGLSGASQTVLIGIAVYYQAWVSLTNVATTHATITATYYGTNITDCGVYWGTVSGTLPNKVSSGSTTSGASITTDLTGLSNVTVYYYKPYITINGGGDTYLDGSERSFTTEAMNTTITTSGTYFIQPGVTSITVECWGGGGAGGGATGTASRGGGGAGGSYSKKAISVTPGNSYTVTIGAGGVASATVTRPGGNTSFSTLVVANGGAGAVTTSGTNGNGATAVTTGSVGTTIYAGGNGGNGVAAGTSGGGGGGAGSTGVGNSATLGTAGAAKANNGGAGGNGVTVANTRTTGSVYGGGGSGGLSSSTTDRTGGNGAAGLMIITYP